MADLLEVVRAYLPDDRAKVIENALTYAQEVHKGQTRKSGEPYVQHPVRAATYLAELSLDSTTLVAALLHDAVEDTATTVDDIRKRFGNDVARLVDGVTKLTRLDLLVTKGEESYVPATDSQAESLRKMLVAMAEDIRVVLIKLADRLHNMQTLDALPLRRRTAIAQAVSYTHLTLPTSDLV